MILCKEAHAKNIDKVLFPGGQGGPLVHVIAAKAVSFLEALQPSFAEYQENIVANAKVLAESLAGEGLRIVTGSTRGIGASAAARRHDGVRLTESRAPQPLRPADQ